MSTNHTANYNLSQWEPSDAVRREEFNADNAKIDEALKAVDDKVSGVSSSVASHTSAIGRLGNCQVYATSYNGNDGVSKTLSFPGYPVWIFIRCPASDITFTLLQGMPDAQTSDVTLNWSSRGVTMTYPNPLRVPFNQEGFKYYVMALLDMSK